MEGVGGLVVSNHYDDGSSRRFGEEGQMQGAGG
jgi:hypothetical protein